MDYAEWIKKAQLVIKTELKDGTEFELKSFDLLSFTISKPRKRSLFKIISPLPFCLKLLKYSY